MPTRDEILAAARKVDPRPLVVPEWGDDPVYLRVLSARDQLALSDGTEPQEMPFRVLVACVCTVDGAPVFEPGDEETLKEFPFPVIMRVFAEAARINGLSSAELEEAAAHFERAQDGDSSSG